MIHTRHPISECEVCAAQVEADEVGAIPTMGHDTDAPPAPDEADKALAQHCLAIDQLRASGCNVTLWCTPRAVVTQITFHDEDASPDIDKSFATLQEAIEFAAASKQER